MEDTELTKKAIEELMREMNEYKEREILPTERKKNPLGRPNKRFLGRTINSMMSHNKRQSDRNHQRCQRKLQEMDAKQRKRDFRNHRRRHSKSQSSHEIISSDSEDEGKANKKCKNLKKKKKKRRKKKQKSSSSSSTTSSSSSSSSSSSETDSKSSSNSSPEGRDKNRKKKKHKKPIKDEVYEQDFYDEYYNDPTMGYYVDPSVAYAAMAYSQMNHIMQQQQIVQQQMVKEELEERVEIPSDLSDLSCHSNSSLNISLNSSSAEEDENGILTFKLISSEDEAKISSTNKNTKEKVMEKTINEENNIEIEESDKESEHSHISLESEGSPKATLEEHNDEICLLSSSDSEDLEIVETIAENISTPLENENSENEESMEGGKDINKVDKENTGDIPNGTDDIDQKSIIIEENLKNSIENGKRLEEMPSNLSMVDLTDD